MEEGSAIPSLVVILTSVGVVTSRGCMAISQMFPRDGGLAWGLVGIQPGRLLCRFFCAAFS